MGPGSSGSTSLLRKPSPGGQGHPSPPPLTPGVCGSLSAGTSSRLDRGQFPESQTWRATDRVLSERPTEQVGPAPAAGRSHLRLSSDDPLHIHLAHPVWVSCGPERASGRTRDQRRGGPLQGTPALFPPSCHGKMTRVFRWLMSPPCLDYSSCTHHHGHQVGACPGCAVHVPHRAPEQLKANPRESL